MAIYLQCFAYENSKRAHKNTKKKCKSFKLDKSNGVIGTFRSEGEDDYEYAFPKHAHFEKCRPPNLMRMFSTENSYW